MRQKILAGLVILFALIVGVPFSPAALAAPATPATSAMYDNIIDRALNDPQVFDNINLLDRLINSDL